MVSKMSDLGIVVFALCFDIFLILPMAFAFTFAVVVAQGLFDVFIGRHRLACFFGHGFAVSHSMVSTPMQKGQTIIKLETKKHMNAHTDVGIDEQQISMDEHLIPNFRKAFTALAPAWRLTWVRRSVLPESTAPANFPTSNSLGLAQYCHCAQNGCSGVPSATRLLEMAARACPGGNGGSGVPWNHQNARDGCSGVSWCHSSARNWWSGNIRFKRSSGTEANSNGHFERSGSAMASPGSHFECCGGTGANPQAMGQARAGVVIGMLRSGGDSFNWNKKTKGSKFPSFKVSDLQSFINFGISKFQKFKKRNFMFVDRSWCHIQVFQELVQPIFRTVRSLSFPFSKRIKNILYFNNGIVQKWFRSFLKYSK